MDDVSGRAERIVSAVYLPDVFLMVPMKCNILTARAVKERRQRAVNASRGINSDPRTGQRGYINHCAFIIIIYLFVFLFTALHYPQQHPAAPRPAGENV